MSLIKTMNLKYSIEAKSLIVVEAAQALAAFDRGDIVAYASSATGAARIEDRGHTHAQYHPEGNGGRQRRLGLLGDA